MLRKNFCSIYKKVLVLLVKKKKWLFKEQINRSLIENNPHRKLGRYHEKATYEKRNTNFQEARHSVNKYEISNDSKCHQGEGSQAPLYSTGSILMVDTMHGSGPPSVKQVLIQLLGSSYLQGSRHLPYWKKTSSKDTSFPWVARVR